jgi:hypothetical protein
MPINLTVNRNRKVSKNYNSEGHGVSITVELDQGLLARPNELRHEIDRLYGEADAALDRQTTNPDQPPSQSDNGSSNGNGTHIDDRLPAMTDSQNRAISAIATRLGLNPIEEARNVLGTEFEDLTIRQASKLIDRLKSFQEAGASRNGGGR